jgi:hypothetical protein
MYVTNGKGMLHNYATELAMYYAEYLSPEQQRSYAFQGAIAALFVVTTILTALAVS